MIIKLEPDLRGMAEAVDLVYDVGEARPFRVTISTSHRCRADDLYRLAVEVGNVLIPAQLVVDGRAS